MAGPNEGNFLTMLQNSGLTADEQADLQQKLQGKEQIEGVYNWPAGLMEAYNLAVQERDQADQQQAQDLAGTQTANVIYDQPPAAPPQDPTPATSGVITAGDPPADPPADPPSDPPIDPVSDPPPDDPPTDDPSPTEDSPAAED